MNKGSKALLSLAAAFFGYGILTFLLGANEIVAAPSKWGAFRAQLAALWFLKLFVIGAVGTVLYLLFTRTPLNIKAKVVGHGQHGDAHFMAPEEQKEVYKTVPFGQEKEPGFLVGVEGRSWVVDTSDNNMLLLSPPGGGKTTGEYIPSITYNGRVNLNTGGEGASILLVDIKGELYRKCAPELQRCGYRTPVLNLREVFQSYRFNIMHQVNVAMDAYTAANNPKEKAQHYGAAERYAKIAAASIVQSMDKAASSEGSEYFNKTAEGLIIGLILLIAECAPPAARHIISVFDVIIQLNGQDDGAGMFGAQRSKMAVMMDKVANKRIQSYVGAATGADIRTALNILSSALAKLLNFMDAELEQLVCGQSPELNAHDFIAQPTAIFVICPDENPTRHFLASLFIRSFCNELIELAETEHGGVLPRPFLNFWDEFGNLPSIQNVVSLFSAIRGRGGRILIALQSYAQLLDNYSKDKANIIRDTCQMLTFSFVAPSAEETATTLSKMLGNETVLSGSTSYSRGVETRSSQMVGRPLLSPAQLVTLEKGVFITMKGGANPYRGRLPGHWTYLQLATELRDPAPELAHNEVATVSADFIRVAAGGQSRKLKKGMFGD